MLKNTYWSHNGTFETAGKQLQALIPEEGSVDRPRKNPKLEKFRKASNAYYDLYNNGLGNRTQDFRTVFGIASSQHKCKRRAFSFTPSLYRMTEEVMDLIVIAAAEEQGIAVVADNVRVDGEYA
jgi:hypothetical protein